MPIEPSRVLGRRFGPLTLAWTAHDAALYARAVGGQADGHPVPGGPQSDPPFALPTFAATLAREARPDFRDVGLDPEAILHLSQGLELLAPLPAAGTADATCEITAIHDAGARGAILETRTTIDASGGEPLAVATSRYLARGAGGFGGTAPPARPRKSAPARPADAAVEWPTRCDQAVLYARLGDRNPLHLDAAAARVAGFDAPILHGLCTFGMVGLAVVRGLCAGEPRRLHSLDLDFRAPVYPGEFLRLEAWRGPASVHLRLLAPGRDGVVTAQGRCSLASVARSSDRR